MDLEVQLVEQIAAEVLDPEEMDSLEVETVQQIEAEALDVVEVELEVG